MNAGKLIAGILAGAAAGAILGILFAPDKGEETRSKIASKSADMKDKFNDFIDGLCDKYESMKDNISGRMEAYEEDADDAVHV
ncbi:MAG: YtxH domain-containing protein [Chitinophagaceae bacterium]